MLRAAMVIAVLALAACGEGDEPEAAQGTEGPQGPAVLIDTGTEEVRVDVEVADDDAERRRGLMFRESLSENAGMVFVFEGDERGGFWMKDTLIPLSIAFYDADGRILRILDMEPCRADPCQIYDPGVEFRGALEVNQGAFRRWGVEAGDRIKLET